MQDTGGFPFLYAFHVYCFYIFPFVYGVQSSGRLWGRLKHYVKNLYPLYLIWCLIGTAVAVFVQHQKFDLLKTFWTIVSGNQVFLAEFCGFAFLWFLPTIVAVMVWRDFYFSLPPAGKIIMFAVSLALWGFSVMFFKSFHYIGYCVPFAIIQGVYFSSSGIIVRWIITRQKISMVTRAVAIPLFCLIPLFVISRDNLPLYGKCLTWLICPVIAFICFYQYKYELSRSKFLKLCGRYSLQIYLLHVVVFNILLRLTLWKNLWSGIGIYIITIGSCLMVAMVLEKTPLYWVLSDRKERSI